MKRWRFALITYLREALKRGLLRSDAVAGDVRKLLTTQYERWWNVDVQPCASKEHFLHYVGRYVRRPPLAQYRILTSTEGEISFRTNVHKLKREVITRYTPREFIERLADHVPAHSRHATRHFGPLGPRSKSHTWPFLFSWGRNAVCGLATSVGHTQLSGKYGNNPLLDSHGERMFLIARSSPLL
jgi:hypothetical protein